MKLVASICFMFLIITSNIFAQNEPIILEAESGVLGSDFSVVNENNITYVKPLTDFVSGDYPANDTKVITFNVSFADTGNYDLFAKVKVGASTYDDDSYFIGNGFGEKSPTIAGDWRLINSIVEAGQTEENETVTGMGNEGAQKWKCTDNCVT